MCATLSVAVIFYEQHTPSSRMECQGGEDVLERYAVSEAGVDSNTSRRSAQARSVLIRRGQKKQEGEVEGVTRLGT